MFQRFDELPNQELEKGILPLGPLEIAHSITTRVSGAR
jgi:hypothetical protein